MSHANLQACVVGPEAQSARRHRRGPGTFRAHHVAICPDRQNPHLSHRSDRMRDTLALVSEMLAQDLAYRPTRKLALERLVFRHDSVGSAWADRCP